MSSVKKRMYHLQRALLSLVLSCGFTLPAQGFFETTDFNFPEEADPFVSSVLTWGRLEALGALFGEINPAEVHRVSAPAYFSRPVEVRQTLFREPMINSRFQLVLREVPGDLVVFVPGLSQRSDSGLEAVLRARALQQGAHFVSLPSILSESFNNARPDFSFDEFEAKTEAYLALIESVIAEIGVSLVKDVRVVGHSFGAFIAAGWSGHEQIFGKNLRSLLLLSPPFELAESFAAFDTLFDHHQGLLGSGRDEWPLRDLIGKVERASQDTSYQQFLAREGVAWVFYQSLFRLAQNALVQGQCAPGMPVLQPGEFGFQNFFAMCFPEAWRKLARRGSLAQRLRERGVATDIRIVFSSDDIISGQPPGALRALPIELYDAEKGGHYGYLLQQSVLDYLSRFL